MDATPEEVERLFASYYERVGRWCFRFTGDRESAADLFALESLLP